MTHTPASRLIMLLAMTAAAALATACNGMMASDSPDVAAADPGPPAPLPASERLALEGRWLITAIDGRPPAGGAPTASTTRPAALAFTPTGYGATVGCNALGGIGTLHGDRYYTMPGPQTLIGCLGLLAEQERALDAVMRASPTLARSRDELQVSGGGHRLTLRRDAQSAVFPAEPAPILAGARFQILSVDGTFLNPRGQTDSRPLAFDAGTWRAQPACGTISGRWRQEGWALHPSEIAVARERCAGDGADGAAIDAAIGALFASDPHFSSGPNGEFLLAGNGHWLTAQRDPAAAERDTPALAGSWDIVSLDGRPLGRDAPETATPRLDFSGASYTGSTGCNTILGSFVPRGGRLYTAPGPTTEKGCGALTAQENRIYALLRGAPRIGRAGQDVRLVDDAGNILLRRATRSTRSETSAGPLPARYTGTALSLNGAPTQNRVGDPASRVTASAREIRFDIGCGMVSAVVRRGRDGMSLISNASSSDGRGCTGPRLAQHNLLIRLANGPVSGIVDANGDLLVAGEGVWLTARRN